MLEIAIRVMLPATVLLFAVTSAGAGAVTRQPRSASRNSPAGVAAHPIRSSAAPRPFEIKGVPLGISLAEFRKLPHPDGYPATVVCTGETYSANDYSSEPSDVGIYNEAKKKAGLIQCVWVLTDASNPYGYGKTIGLKVGGSEYAMNEYVFAFIPDPADGVSKLFRYQGITNQKALDPVVDALTAKYGPPKEGSGRIQNGIGNTFEQTTAAWSNSLGTIEVTAPAQTVTMMSVVVTDRRLSAAADAAVRAQGSSSNPI